MSAIAGLLRYDGGTVTRHCLERAANALRQYGPDRADIAVADSIGLVHVLMRMTPEDQFDRQPWQGASGALITADVRLDNRDEVLERTGIAQSQARAWPDSRVLLAGWEKFGDALWPMLRGPFAVAIWDSRRRALTLARDHLGLNVVMWHKSVRFFAFATMPNGLFALDDVPRQLSEEKFADFLVTTPTRTVFLAAEKDAAQDEAGHALGIFEAIGQRQGAAPRATEKKPLFDAQVRPQFLHVSHEIAGRLTSRRVPDANGAVGVGGRKQLAVRTDCR